MSNSTLLDAIESVIYNLLAELHTCLPAKVIEYNAATQKASVQPLIKRRYKDAGNDSAGLVDMPIIVAVPVVFPSAAGGLLSFPVKAGDVVMLVFAERSIDNFLFSDGSIPIDPQDFRKHNYSDAIAIPGLYPFSKALGADPNNVELRFNVGTANENKIALKPNGDIAITGPAKFNVTTTGNVDIHTSGAATLTASSSTVNGDLTVNGNINSSGTVTATTDVVGGGKSLKTHTHSGVTTGSGTSGPPV